MQERKKKFMMSVQVSKGLRERIEQFAKKTDRTFSDIFKAGVMRELMAFGEVEGEKNAESTIQ